jgi:SSS family solute:Na+ symporter
VVIAGVVVMNVSAAEGGLVSLLETKGIESSYFSLFGQGPAFILFLLLPTVMYTLIGQDFYQRLFAAKNAKVARTSALVAGVFLILISAFPTLIGMGARGLGPEVLEGKDAVVWVLQSLVNPLLGGVIIAAILAAIMSSADSLLTAATSHIVKDVWMEVLRPDQEHDEKSLLNLARLTTLFVGISALLIGLISDTIVGVLIYAYAMYTAGVLVPVLGGVFWSRATRSGAIAAVVVGSAIALTGILGGISIWGMPTEIYGAGGSAIAFVVVSLLTKEEPTSLAPS